MDKFDRNRLIAIFCGAITAMLIILAGKGCADDAIKKNKENKNTSTTSAGNGGYNVIYPDVPDTTYDFFSDYVKPSTTATDEFGNPVTETTATDEFGNPVAATTATDEFGNPVTTTTATDEFGNPVTAATTVAQIPETTTSTTFPPDQLYQIVTDASGMIIDVIPITTPEELLAASTTTETTKNYYGPPSTIPPDFAIIID